MKSRDLKRLVVIICCLHCFSEGIAQSVSGIINSYHRITAIGSPTNTLTLGNAAGLVPGTKVLIIQMKGADINSSNSALFGDVMDIREAGNYEFSHICSVAGNEVILTNQLLRSYNTLGSVQLITVPQYNILTISGNLMAAPWDGLTQTGGVLVFEADTVYLNNDINVSGQGFAGGGFVNFSTPVYDCVWATTVSNYFLQLSPVPDQYYSGGPKGEGIATFIANAEYGKGKQANGGGGGNNHNTGGGGGANSGTGGHGGRRTNESFFLCHGAHPGIGGASLSSFGYTLASNRLFMGGGGGSGHQNNAKGTPGGNGGGIVIINANIVVSSGSIIQADGLSPVNLTNTDPYTAEGDGAGGGGAGGSIILNIDQVIGTLSVRAAGGRGSDASRGVNDCTGPGGGGGGGVIWMKGATFSPLVSGIVSGGSNGVVSMLSGIAACRGLDNGATPGGAGAMLANYVPPAMGNFICASLFVPELKSFEGKKERNNVVLKWTMHKIDNINAYEVERSVDQVHYSKIAQVAKNNNYAFSATDKEQFTGTVYYRLKLIYTNGHTSYSRIITVSSDLNSFVEKFHFFPNPVAQELNVTTFSRKSLTAKLSILNTAGQRIYVANYKIAAGHTKFIVPVKTLSEGVYWLLLEANGSREGKLFIKQK